MDKDEYSCVICKAECLSDCVLCDECSNWTHFKCMNITESEMTHLDGGRRALEGFYCTKCCSGEENGQFSYEKSLYRLSEASRNSMRSVALIEQIMIKQMSTTNDDEETFDYTNQKVDDDSCKLLKTFRTSNHVALRSTPGGNCVFNSLSILLFGNEKSSVSLRVKTCIYMALHKEAILESIPKDLLSVSSDFDESLIKCSRYDSWPDSISIFAAASALSVNIKMIYPPINGLDDSNIGSLNWVRTPLGKNPTRTLMIMWTGGFTISKGLDYEGDCWIPNHIVPVVLKSDNNPETDVKLETEDKLDTLETEDTLEDESTIQDDSTSHSENENSVDLNKSDEITLLPGGTGNDSENGNVTDLNVSNEIIILPGSTRNNGEFWDTDQIIDILINKGKQTVGEIPLGKKENCYFVVSNEDNIEEKSKDLTSLFNDDCGVWTDSSLKKAYYFIDRNGSKVQYKYVEQKSGKYYIRKKKSTLMVPQPKEDEILVLKKRYNKLVGNKEFQRKISYFENSGTVAVIEYKGYMPRTSALLGKRSVASDESPRKKEAWWKIKEVGTKKPMRVGAPGEEKGGIKIRIKRRKINPQD